jgi:hypothetical protein
MADERMAVEPETYAVTPQPQTSIGAGAFIVFSFELLLKYHVTGRITAARELSSPDSDS